MLFYYDTNIILTIISFHIKTNQNLIKGTLFFFFLSLFCFDFLLEFELSLQDWLGLPAGVKFDPTDQELIEHLEAKVEAKDMKSHPLIDEFIPTIEGEDGICYTHPEKLPGQKLEYYLCVVLDMLTLALFNIVRFYLNIRSQTKCNFMHRVCYKYTMLAVPIFVTTLKNPTCLQVCYT